MQQIGTEVIQLENDGTVITTVDASKGTSSNKLEKHLVNWRSEEESIQFCLRYR